MDHLKVKRRKKTCSTQQTRPVSPSSFPLITQDIVAFFNPNMNFFSSCAFVFCKREMTLSLMPPLSGDQTSGCSWRRVLWRALCTCCGRPAVPCAASDTTAPEETLTGQDGMVNIVIVTIHILHTIMIISLLRRKICKNPEEYIYFKNKNKCNNFLLLHVF